MRVGFFHQVFDFSFGVAAIVVAAVGDDQQRFARVPGLLHLVKRQVDGVQQRGAAFGVGEGEPVLNLLEAGGERLDQLGGIVELHQKELVLGIGGLEELRHGLPGFVQFAPHAAAAIEHHPHGNGSVLARELSEILLFACLENFEILLFQPRDKAVHGVRDRHRDEHQGAVDADVGFGYGIGANRRLGTGLDANLSPHHRR